MMVSFYLPETMLFSSFLLSLRKWVLLVLDSPNKLFSQDVCFPIVDCLREMTKVLLLGKPEFCVQMFYWGLLGSPLGLALLRGWN